MTPQDARKGAFLRGWTDGHGNCPNDVLRFKGPYAASYMAGYTAGRQAIGSQRTKEQDWASYERQSS